MKKWFWVYVAGFIALTGADVVSTIFGIAAGASEFNHTLATSEGGLKIAQFLLVNAAMLAFTSYMLIWAWPESLFRAECAKVCISLFSLGARHAVLQDCRILQQQPDQFRSARFLNTCRVDHFYLRTGASCILDIDLSHVPTDLVALSSRGGSLRPRQQ